MKDAGIETKRATEIERQRPTEGSTTNLVLAVSLGKYEAAVRTTLEQARKENVVKRIWDRDASLWRNEESHQKIIANSLGWLTVSGEMLEAAKELKAFAESIRASKEFHHVMVCGMGGSSLCPEVLRQTFGRQEDFPALLVLDSTDPDAINNFAKQIEIARCLFIVASKSGTTTEPLVFHRYWYNEVARKSAMPGQSFVAITDPGSQMADTAVAEGFRRIFLNQPDIGGRYSALSYFGMVPAVLVGLDIEELLARAKAMGDACGATVAGDANQNPGAILGAVMAECALGGRNKLTIVTDRKISALGLWVEQLVAESTGKEGKGIVPVVGEPLGAVSAYGDDRLFVSISVGTIDGEMKSRLEALEEAGHPVVYRNLVDVYDLGAEFFLWEMATAFAGWRLAINPFDQPNVEESKDATKALLEKFTQEGALPEPPAVASDGTITIVGAQDASAAGSASVADVMTQHMAGIKPGDYLALLAYVEESPEIDAAIQAIRTTLRGATGCATTTGYGPRFLHSTGQLHKGGPDSGVFIQITAPDQIDLDVPGAPYTFSVLKQAQAQGDFQSLLLHGRRAIRVDLGADALTGLARLRELINSVVAKNGRSKAQPEG